MTPAFAHQGVSILIQGYGDSFLLQKHQCTLRTHSEIDFSFLNRTSSFRSSAQHRQSEPGFFSAMRY
ncbi:hypothetical protein BPOR_0144g00140 [Botrytis porri]|uniref:Uncharacterized protein n=1 Tax=Botrytis porri TaxID=87229 RepID=A0A4Z1KW15_9HELO|nr:hypothetical protein BPOR_0144g00140 [Botrytis porri]